MGLFLEKGFRATTMENIVSRVTLSKGGVYRLYPSTEAILQDLILEGMRLRNQFYADQAEQYQHLTLKDVIRMVVESLLVQEEFSRIYVEFLWEKQRSPSLEALYQQICQVSMEETKTLIRSCGAEELLLADEGCLERLTDLMNTAILGIRVLGLDFAGNREKITEAIFQMMQ